jgi:hypothetical protein
MGTLTAFLIAATGFIGTLALLVANLTSIRSAWCANVEFFCSLDVTSGDITEESGGTPRGDSDVCKTHSDLFCLRVSAPNHRFIVGSTKFHITDRGGGVFVDGDPKSERPEDTSNIGWYIHKPDETPEKICAQVYARTSACETRVFIKGHLTAKERRVGF